MNSDQSLAASRARSYLSLRPAAAAAAAAICSVSGQSTLSSARLVQSMLTRQAVTHEQNMSFKFHKVSTAGQTFHSFRYAPAFRVGLRLFSAAVVCHFFRASVLDLKCTVNLLQAKLLSPERESECVLNGFVHTLLCQKCSWNNWLTLKQHPDYFITFEVNERKSLFMSRQSLAAQVSVVRKRPISKHYICVIYVKFVYPAGCC